MLLMQRLGTREPSTASLGEHVRAAWLETQLAFASPEHSGYCVDSCAGGDALVYGFRGRVRPGEECVRGPFGKGEWLPHLRSVHGEARGGGGEAVVQRWGPLCQHIGAAMCVAEPVAYIEQHMRMGACDEVLEGAVCFPPRSLQVCSPSDPFLACAQLVIRERGVLAADACELESDEEFAAELLLQYCAAHSDHADVDEVEVVAYFTHADASADVVVGGLGGVYAGTQYNDGPGLRLCLRLRGGGGRSSSSGVGGAGGVGGGARRRRRNVRRNV